MAERRDTKNRILLKGEYQKPDGRYMYRYTEANGKTGFVYSWTLTPTDRTPHGKKPGACLRDLEKDISAKISAGTPVSSGKKITLNDVFENYVELRQDLKSTTRMVYNHAYEKHVRPRLGKMRIADIKYSHIKKLYNDIIADSGLKPASLVAIDSIIRAIFLVAIRDNYVKSNPAEGALAEIKRRSEAATKRRSLTKEEQEVFLSYVKGHTKFKKWYPLFMFLLGTGCRIGETLGLTWGDCDFKNGIVSIDHSLIYVTNEKTKEYEFHISSTKSCAGVRQIPMFESVRSILVKEYQKQMSDGFCQVDIDGYSHFVFSNRNKTVYTTAQVDRAIYRVVKSYNEKEVQLAELQDREPILLPRMSAHILRHTFCTRLCENITDLKLIQEIMGHASIATTMNIYNDVSLETKQSVLSDVESKMALM